MSYEKPAIFRSTFNAAKLTDEQIAELTDTILAMHGIFPGEATAGQVDEIASRLRFAGF